MATGRSLTLSVLPEVFAVCRLPSTKPIPSWCLHGFFSITRTEEELSIVCPQSSISPEAKAVDVEGGWRCFRVEGSLDFALTGILVAIAAPLADAGLSIFAISTYNTDYVLVKQRDFDQAVQALAHVGHRVTYSDA